MRWPNRPNELKYVVGENWESLVERGMSGMPYLACCTNSWYWKQKKTEGRMDEWTPRWALPYSNESFSMVYMLTFFKLIPGGTQMYHMEFQGHGACSSVTAQSNLSRAYTCHRSQLNSGHTSLQHTGNIVGLTTSKFDVILRMCVEKMLLGSVCLKQWMQKKQ